MSNETMEMLATFVMGALPITSLDSNTFLPALCTLMEMHCIKNELNIVEFAEMVAEIIKETNAKEGKE